MKVETDAVSEGEYRDGAEVSEVIDRQVVPCASAGDKEGVTL